jgi:hypothetical protein
MAMKEPALLNAMLALAASHVSKWRNVQDTESQKYLRQALLHLQKTIKDPVLAQRESTLGVILCLVSYEVCCCSLACSGMNQSSLRPVGPILTDATSLGIQWKP